MSKSAKDGPRRSLDDSIYTTADEEKFDSEDHGHTLSAMQGRRLRNELSCMALRGVDGFDGDDALGAEGVSPQSTPTNTPGTTPSTTLTGDEQVALSRAIAADPMSSTAARSPSQNRRESMPSSGHARVSATMFAPAAGAPMGSIGEEGSVHGGKKNDLAPGGVLDDDWKTQLEASDDEADPGDVTVNVAKRSSLKKNGPPRRTSFDTRPTVAASSMPKSRRTVAPGVAASGASTGDGGDGGSLDRRTALRSVARDVESLMLISDVLTCKEMPVLAKRLREGLGRIQNNARAGYKNEGLTSSHHFLRRVNRYDLLKQGYNDMKAAVPMPRLPRMSVNFGGRLSLGPSSILTHVSPPKKKSGGSDGGDPPGTRSFKEHCVRAGIVGVILLVLCCIPHILQQYEPDSVIAATNGAYVTGADPVELTVSHTVNGLYELTLGAGKCHAYAPTDSTNTNNTYYSAIIALTQDDLVLKEDSLKLHDKGVSSPSKRRHLLSGGGSSGPAGAYDYETFYFDVNPKRSGGNVIAQVWTDCPNPLGVSLEVVSIGPVGTSQHWIALVLLIGVFALIITEVRVAFPKSQHCLMPLCDYLLFTTGNSYQY